MTHDPVLPFLQIPETSAEAYQVIDRLSPRQLEVLGLLAINQEAGHHPATLRVLARRGLIVGEEVTLPGRVPVRVRQYHVPIFVHLAWCQWCTDHVTEEEDA